MLVINSVILIKIITYAIENDKLESMKIWVNMCIYNTLFGSSKE